MILIFAPAPSIALHTDERSNIYVIILSFKNAPVHSMNICVYICM